MFKQEAKNYKLNLVSELRDKLQQGCNCKELSDIEVAFQKGADLGYNKGYHDAEEHYMNVIDSQHKLVDESKKAEDWHFIKDGDLPKDEEFKWCVSARGVCYIARYEELFVSWTNQEHKEVCCPYAWKEIKLPEEMQVQNENRN